MHLWGGWRKNGHTAQTRTHEVEHALKSALAAGSVHWAAPSTCCWAPGRHLKEIGQKEVHFFSATSRTAEVRHTVMSRSIAHAACMDPLPRGDLGRPPACFTCNKLLPVIQWLDISPCSKIFCTLFTSKKYTFLLLPFLLGL